MKQLKLVGTILFASALFISGCSNESKEVTAGKKDDPLITTEKEVAGGSIESGDGFGFTEFDLDIEINGEDAVDIEYDVEEKAEAEYKNELTNVFLDKAEAMDEVGKLFIDILITKDTPEDEVIEKVLKFLRIENYSKFELEVKFDDGTKLDIKDEK